MLKLMSTIMISIHHLRRYRNRLLVFLLLTLCVPLALPPAPAQAQILIPGPDDFKLAAPQGFGDRQNSGAWSMQWWNGHLYVGTARSWYCWVQAGLHVQYPQVPYPPIDSTNDCPANILLLPLEAEIWRHSPVAGTWKRVYKSPRDLLVPGHPGNLTSRDIGYRGMAVFKEGDGQEALYVGAATSYLLWPPTPAPRILRSINGINFTPIPQDPGTVLGDLGQDQATFRGWHIYNNRLYVLNGAIRGEGSVLETRTPEAGNDSYRWVTPQDMKIYEMHAFNGSLYLGVATDFVEGYSVVKTDATGPLPYEFTTVVPSGAYVEEVPTNSVVSMFVYQDRLYVGTNRPVELIRINPDDSWDLIVGRPRDTPEGRKEPLSGLGSGFDWVLNAHLWRMAEHEDVLYMSTLDQSSQLADIPELAEELGGKFGFDLYATADGVNMTPITVNGLGDPFQVGVRTFASTPYGLYVGGVSYSYGFKLYRYVSPATSASTSATTSPATSAVEQTETLYLPLFRDTQGRPAGTSAQPAQQAVSAPTRLMAEPVDNHVVLSWEGAGDGTTYHILRAGTLDVELPPSVGEDPFLGIPAPDPNEPILGSFAEIGTTQETFFVDDTAEPGEMYHYYVVAEDQTGAISNPSNLARVPLLLSPMSFTTLSEKLGQWRATASAASTNADTAVATIAAVDASLSGVQAMVAAADYVAAWNALEDLRQAARQDNIEGLATWQATDLELLVARLQRRIDLVQKGLLAPTGLN